MALDAAYQSRLEALFEWRADFIQSNVDIVGQTAGNVVEFGYIRSDVREVEMANGITDVLARALAEIYEVPAALTQWDLELGAAITLMTPLESLGALAGSAG